jgi:thiamine-phosphate pyrophosphorylase
MQPDCYLYGILDLGYVVPDRVKPVTELLVQGGVDLLQLRAKDCARAEIARLASEMLPVAQRAGIPLIINDYPELLREVAAEGCHVGQDDGTVAEARERAGRPCIVGKSTHSLEQAIAAELEGADYIGFGPLFPTGTKPTAKAVGLEKVSTIVSRIRIPVFCIGGVKLSNLREIMAAGADRVCIVSDILLATDIGAQIKKIKEGMRRNAL